MKRIYIDQIRTGDIVGDFFVVAQCERKSTQANKPFLTVTLSDSTGKVQCVCWDNVPRLETILVTGKIVRIEAAASTYRDELQLKITDARPVKETDKVDDTDFIQSAPFDIEHTYRQLLEYKNSISNSKIRELLDCFFENDICAKAFKYHPAAKRMHHAYAGGLLEHTLGIVKSCDLFSKNYPYLNRNLLLAGAMLHDIGKLKEMKGGLATEYTTSGQLMGHLVIGSQMIEKAAATISDFPDETKLLLQHLVLSHHGKLEFGSPVKPATLEALVLHSLDMLDAHLFEAKKAIDEEKNAEFTGFVYGLEAKFFTHIDSDTNPTISLAPVAPKIQNIKELNLEKNETATQESLL